MSKQKNVKLKPITHHLIYTEMNKRMKVFYQRLRLEKIYRIFLKKLRRLLPIQKLLRESLVEVRIKELIS